jgi:hypothetical protein
MRDVLPASFRSKASAIPLWSDWMVWQKINYIHANPVKAGLVASARDYRWSSFHAYYPSSRVSLAVDREWWWPDDSEKLSRAVKDLGLTLEGPLIGGGKPFFRTMRHFELL